MRAFRSSWLQGASVLGLVMFLIPAAAAGPLIKQINLVASDPSTVALAHDPKLINAWGMSHSATSPFWVSATETGLSPVYRGDGSNPLTVAIAPAPGNTVGSPTGQVNNATTGFELTPGNPARFLFVTEDGTISGWNPAVNAASSVIKVDNSSNGANYKGLAIGTTGGNTYLYAANFTGGKIEVYNSSFAPTSLPGSFTDPAIPAGYAPFNVQNLGGRLFVAYALESGGDEVTGAGNGFVDEFDLEGNFVARVVSNGVLNAPWGLDFAPEDWGVFGGALLVGNFGDGLINVFDPTTYALLGVLKSAGDRQPLEIDGLWALMNGNGSAFTSPDLVYFTAGPDDEEQGLFGSLAAVPEPATLPLLASGLVLLGWRWRRR